MLVEDKLKIMIDVFNEESGVDITKNTKKYTVAFVRNVYFHAARQMTGASLSTIGSPVGRTHASVTHGINTYIDEHSKQSSFKSLHDKCIHISLMRITKERENKQQNIRDELKERDELISYLTNKIDKYEKRFKLLHNLTVKSF